MARHACSPWCISRLLIPLFAAAVLAACSSSIAGVAASGLPLAGGTVYLVDSAGHSASASVAADGSYQLTVKDMTGPFLLEALGFAGGSPVVLHSAATATDVLVARKVNITPLTELGTAYVLGTWPAEVFRQSNRNLAPLTDAALRAASATVRSEVGAVLDAFGVAGDPRTLDFKADGTGMDRALDALKLVPTQEAGTGKARYELSLFSGSTPVVIDPAAPASGALLTFTAGDKANLEAALAALPSINGQFQALAVAFKNGLPAKASILPFFATDAQGFRHNGLALDPYIDGVLLKDGNVGFTTSPATIVGFEDETHVWVTTRMFTAMKEGALSAGPMDQPGLGADQWEERFLMRRNGAGVWQIAGNQALAGCAVNNLARLNAKSLTEAEVAALPGIGILPDFYLNGVLHDYCYFLPGVSDPNWIVIVGCHGDATFPIVVYDTWPPQAATTRVIGHPSGGVERFVEFWVSSSQIDPRVTSVKVTGPGIPSQGLTLVRSPPEFPRGGLIIAGDEWHWDTLNDDRCQNYKPPVANCGLDWSQLALGSKFTFDFLDGMGTSLGTEQRRLRGTPRSETEWLARKDSMFPLVTNTARYEVSWANILDTSAGAPFLPGGTEIANWKVPTDAIVSMHFVGMWRNYNLNDSGLPADARDEGCSYLLYGDTSRSRSCTWSAASKTTWSWIDLGARDLYGNMLWHEVNPGNPY
jgi:hypothetical protein